jgi:hypothetical protein
MPYTLVDTLQWSLLHPFSRKEWLSNPEDGGSKFLRNNGTYVVSAKV